MPERYIYQAIQGSGISEVDYRITDRWTDDRIATCCLEENARLVVGLMNSGIAAPAMISALRALIEWIDSDYAAGEGKAIVRECRAALAFAGGGNVDG